MHRAFLLVLTLIITGCGSRQIDYQPSTNAITSRAQAEQVIEKSFYEDYGQARVSSMTVTRDYLLLSNGLVTRSQATGVAQGGIAVASGTAVTAPDEARIYYSSIGSAKLYTSKNREGRYTVILRRTDDSVIRHVRFRNAADAKQFIDAIDYLKRSSRA